MIKAKLDRKNRNIILLVSCWMVYIITNFAKSNYSATVAYIVQQSIFTKSQTGAIASAFYIFFGIGQFIGGSIVDKISPYKMIKVGIVSAFIANIILCFTMNYTVILIVWSINGFMHLGIWPGITKIVADYLSPYYKPIATQHLSYGHALGSLMSYICSALLINKFGWVGMFGTSSMLLAGALIFWLLTERLVPMNSILSCRQNVQKKRNEETTMSAKKKYSVMLSSGLVLALLPTLCLAMLNNGAQLWIPTLMMESYTTSLVFANLQTVLLLLVSIIGGLVFGPLLNRIKNEMLGHFILTTLIVVPFLVLQFIGVIPIWLALMMFTITIMVMTLGNVFKVRISTRFHKYRCSGTVSGLLHTMTSFGVVLSGYGYGFLAENFGWSAVTFSWIVLIVITLFSLALSAVFWGKFMKK